MIPAPFFKSTVRDHDHGQAHWLKTDDGHRIRAGHWTLPKAKGTVLIFPGRTEYVEKYTKTALALGERGYACVAIDWRGQGLSDRLTDNHALGHVQQFSDYQNDVAALLDHVRSLDLPKPYFLLGHSMGGCIGLRALLNGLDVNAAAFSAPMWGIQIAPALRPVAWGLSTISIPFGFDHLLAPTQQAEAYILRADFAGNKLTADRAAYDCMRRQLRDHPELQLGGATLRWLNESLREMNTLSLAPVPETPCVTFLGTDEAIVDPIRIQNKMDHWENGDLHVIENGRHEVLMDNPTMRESVYTKTTTLFDAHL